MATAEGAAAIIFYHLIYVYKLSDWTTDEYE